MEVTDPSDSDSTLLVSEPKIRRLNKRVGVSYDGHELNGASKYFDAATATATVAEEKSNHRIVIQVRVRTRALALTHTHTASNRNLLLVHYVLLCKRGEEIFRLQTCSFTVSLNSVLSF